LIRERNAKKPKTNAIRPGAATTSSSVHAKESLSAQYLPVEEDHEVGQIALVDAVAADLPHQVHAERVAAECEEQPLAERQDAGVAPDQVHRERHDRVAHELAEQRDPEARHVKWAGLGDGEMKYRNDHDQYRRYGEDRGPDAQWKQARHEIPTRCALRCELAWERPCAALMLPRSVPSTRKAPGDASE
jgi:hypothetical protein